MFNTPGTKWLEERNVPFKRFHNVPDLIGRETYIECTSRQLGIPTSLLLKTIVIENPTKKEQHPVVLVMRGDLAIDMPAFAKEVGFERARLCKADRAHGYTGYEFGGTSPFGLVRESDLKVYLDQSIIDAANHSDVWINGGGIGNTVAINIDDLLGVLKPTVVSVSKEMEKK